MLERNFVVILLCLAIAFAFGLSSPANAQGFDETVGYISEKLTAADRSQALSVTGPCALSFRGEYNKLLVDVNELSKSSLRIERNPSQWILEVQCFNHDCVKNPGAIAKSHKAFRKIVMKINVGEEQRLKKAWEHILDVCGAKTRRELF